MLAIGSSATPCFAFKEPKYKQKVAAGDFIDEYGKAFVEYSKRVEAAHGKLSPQERTRAYEETFGGAKKAYEQERDLTRKRLLGIANYANRSMEKAKAGKRMPFEKKDLKSATKLANKMDGETPSKKEAPAESIAPAVAKNTGEIGKAGGADVVRFDAPTPTEIKGPAPASEGAAKGVQSGGAETVSFGGH